MPFKRASWNPVSRTFRATASFSRDMGKYEEVVTLDGVEVEEYELVFSEDFEAIVGGECCSFFPNASKPEKCQPFGGQAGSTYVRWQRPAVAARLWKDRSCSEEAPRILELSAAARASLALLERNGRSFRLSLESGDSVQSTVDALQLWQRMRWDPGDAWRSQAQQLTTPLLVAAVLLQWPEGVELCIRFGADAAWPTGADCREQVSVPDLQAYPGRRRDSESISTAEEEGPAGDGSRHTGALQEVDGSLEGRSTRLKRSLHRAEEQPLALRYSRAPKGEGQSLQEDSEARRLKREASGREGKRRDLLRCSRWEMHRKRWVVLPPTSTTLTWTNPVSMEDHCGEDDWCLCTRLRRSRAPAAAAQTGEPKLADRDALLKAGLKVPIEARLGLKPRQIRGSESASSEAYALAVLLRDTSAASPRPLLLRAEEVPLRYRTPKWFQIQRPGGLPVPLVQGCSQSGHGDVIWAAAEFCAEALVKGDLEVLVGPVRGRRVLEVGAGVGLPSCTAVRCGAQVVSSDIPDHERVLALATSLVLNLQEASAEQEMACCAPRARAVPHYWGDSCELLCSEGAFDLLLCCDCLYIPDLHGPLLDTICGCLSSAGVALVCFSLHRTAPKTVIFGFFDLARSRGLEVELFCERQLPPRCANMPLERSYVYAYTLRRGSLTESQEPVCGG
ncbi:unnamed protein product [Polarella glacialis]|uniref:Calmodulin-lysine N-methyltransferase n=1 Tax=Polarella glacialis TaxID=89957 RepID=A0A813FRZ2_POLGL|nr:unnamed protein product [Polarella glacialis]